MDPDPPPTALRVATFNIRNGRAYDRCRSWPFRRRGVAQAVAGLDADVAALQEVYEFQLRSLRRRLSTYDAVGEGRDGAGHGEQCPVLWRPDRVRLLDHVTRWYGPTPGVAGSGPRGARFPRVATICRFAVGSHEVQVVTTHLDAHDDALRAAGAEQLVGWLDEALPVVVLGDLNAMPGGPVLDLLLAAGLRDAMPADAGGTFHRFTGRIDGPRFDYILVRGAIEVMAGTVEHPRPGGRVVSDHWPLVADLRIGGSPSG